MTFSNPFSNPLTTRIAEFITSIGIGVQARKISEPTFFPGMKIELGEVIIDETTLKHPGDLLHEAGHIALLPEQERSKASGDVKASGGVEISVTAWCFAASVHLGFDAAEVFHPESYGGGGEALLESFNDGRYIGVPLLQLWGMTADEKRARDLNVPPYPAMRRWLR